MVPSVKMDAKLILTAGRRCLVLQARGCVPYFRRNLVHQGSRCYATQDTLGKVPKASRKQITVANDDGRVNWKELSTTEKAARTTQQTFNLGVILTGLVMTGGCAYFLYKEVFSTDSKTVQFNRAVDRVRSDSRVKEALGSGHKIRAFGEPTWNRWARARPIASNTYKDPNGTEHFMMHFNVEGSSRRGVVNLHTFKGPGGSDWQYKYLALDVKGQPRLYLENTDATPEKQRSSFNFLGMQWRK
ncbi:mitochondrial import inner membrane translocase subunit tim21 [Xanthoria parietina]